LVDPIKHVYLYFYVVFSSSYPRFHFSIGIVTCYNIFLARSAQSSSIEYQDGLQWMDWEENIP